MKNNSISKKFLKKRNLNFLNNNFSKTTLKNF